MVKFRNLSALLISAALICSGAPAFGQDTLKTEQEKISYALGINIGQNLKKDVDVDIDAFFKGIKDSQTEKSLLSDEEMKQTMMAFQKKMQQKQQVKMQKAAQQNKADGAAFLKANKKEEGVKTLESGLQYKVIKKGEGASPKASDTVKCNYKGTTIDGEVFDSSYKRGEPASFQVDGVIKGWTEALQLMKVGSKWELFIPSDLAYGDSGAGKAIAPGSTLIFEVELLGIEG
ncbi:MAG: FKBP-type peptidyl-prolyl cis-trans isomerase [Desulfobacteraceae bacterium]